MIDKALALLAPHHCYFCRKTGPIVCCCCKDYILRRANFRKMNFTKLQKTGEIFYLQTGDDWLKKMIYDYKLNSRRAYAGFFAQVICASLPSKTKLTIVPAPTMRKSFRQRGFGHVELIAKELAQLGHEYLPILENTSTLAQKNLDAAARQLNARENLICRQNLSPKRKYLVIDDITTTGSTLKYARLALKQAGAKQVACLALVHA